MPLPTDPAAFLKTIRVDFGEFVKAIWDDRGLHKVAPLSWVELDICDYIATGPKFRGVLAPRGLGKTHLGPAMLSAYRLYRDANRKILIPSKSHSHAKKIVSILRQWIETVWFLQHLRPRPEQVDSATQFQVGPARPSLQPSVTAVGIDGMLEGNRAHTVLPDDVETDTNTETPESREDLENRLGELKDILYPDNPELEGAPVDPPEIVYVGTYHHEESVYLKLNAKGYIFRTWPIIYPHPDEATLNLAPKLQAMLDSGKAEPDDLIFPLRFNRQNVVEKQAEGFTRFAMQHKLIASLGDTNRYPLRLADLIVFDVATHEAPVQVSYGQRSSEGSTQIEGIKLLGFTGDRLYRPIILAKEVAPYTGTKGGLDPAGRGDDKTGLSIVSHLAGNLFVKCCLGLPGGNDTEALALISRTLRDHDCRDLYLESNIDVFGAYEQLLNASLRRHFLEPGQDDRFPKGWKCSLTAQRAPGTTNKEVRIINTLEPYATNHRLIVARSVVTPQDGESLYNQFQYQWTHITKQRKCLKEDGRLDSLEIAVRAWDHAMGASQEKAQERTKLELTEEWMRKNGMITKRKEPARWFKIAS